MSIPGTHNQKEQNNILLDGVRYSACKTRLLYYNPNKKDEGFAVPTHVKAISKGAFQGNKYIKTIKIHPQVENIPAYSFFANENLQNIFVDSRNQTYSSVNGVLYDKKVETLMKYPEGKQDSNFHLRPSVNSIAEDALYHMRHLEFIHVDENNKIFTSVDGVLYALDQKKLIKYPP